jgi:hypothetical protein
MYEKNLRQTGKIITLEDKNEKKRQRMRDIRKSAQRIAAAAETTSEIDGQSYY